MSTAKFWTPSEIAKETLRQLASRRLPPTPENYAELYRRVAKANIDSRAVPEPEGLQSETHAKGSPDPREPSQQTPSAHQETADALRELLARAVIFSVVEDPQSGSEIANEAHTLAQYVRCASVEQDIKDIQRSLREFWLKLERAHRSDAGLTQELTRLVRQMTRSMGEFVVKDSWLKHQLGQIQQLLETQIDPQVLRQVEEGLSSVVLKQGMRKQTLEQAESNIKKMVSLFIDRLAAITSSTGEYHEKLERYAVQIRETDELETLGKLINSLMSETRTMQSDVLRSREELVAVRAEVQAHQDKIRLLEQELEVVSGLVKEDPLTRALNRRGLQDAFRVEMARCERRNLPLSIALIDIDDFKKLNDTLGHPVGDAALVHLADTVREILRATDWLARYGGEEFLVLLPETGIQDAVEALHRVQIVLARQALVQDGQTVPFTFSAGVTQRNSGETDTDMVERADRALYRAKAEGKNRVVAAD